MRSAARSGNDWFFLAFALGLAAIVFGGFSETFYLRDPAATPLPELLVAHGLVLTAWFVLVPAQAGLIRANHVRLHRAVGVAGLGVALAAAATGWAVGARALAHGVTAGPLSPEGFFFLSASDAAGFVLLILAAAAAALTNGAAHKRLIALASVSILLPATTRLAQRFDADPFFGVGLQLGLVGAIAAFDLLVLRRVHWATAAGAAVIIAKLAATAFVAESQGWAALARLLAGVR